MTALDEAQKAEFIAGYAKLLTAAWSAGDFDAFVAEIDADPAGVLGGYGLPMPVAAEVEIRTTSDGGESLDQAAELWAGGMNGGNYVLYVVDTDIVDIDLSGVAGGMPEPVACCCCPCCSCT